MREQNFSLPTANKASISITTALYDRRALDCTSTLPLIHSLNNLAYLTISSGRIRDILTVDGGIERLVCILKGGRSKDTIETWKWSLAFQCIVNIGVRGSEAVRTRVVEADMVPVIATILDSYFKVLEKTQEIEQKSKCPATRSFARVAKQANEAFSQRSERSRRHAPPPIAIPEPQEQADQDDPMSDTTPTAPTANLSLSSPPERTTFPRQLYHQRSHGGRAQLAPTSAGRGLPADQPLAALPSQASVGTYGFRPVRDVDRLPSMVTRLDSDLSSQPQSPATPSAPVARPGSPSIAGLRRRRPSIRHQLSTSGSDDDGQAEEAGSDELNDADTHAVPEPHVDIQSDIVMQDIVSDDDALLEPRGTNLTPNETETFNITHRTSTDGSAIIPSPAPAPNTAAFLQTQIPPTLNPMTVTPPTLTQTPAWLPQLSQRAILEQRSPPSIPGKPRDEDVLMSLQLLAYVTKYCNLRSYFQHSHLVPRLKVDRDLHLLDPSAPHPNKTPQELEQEMQDEDDAEFVSPESFNIFPLIEKFTAKSRHPSNSSTSQPTTQQSDMSYWAGVVMRNLCRKDDARGGIRQCAYHECMKWEQFPREFAKCRRCRRTKYCSKACQKGAWGSHRFWCVAAEEAEGRETRHRHGHSHHHHHHAARLPGSGTGTTPAPAGG